MTTIQLGKKGANISKILLLLLYRCDPFSGNVFSSLLPLTFSLPCCCLAVPYLEQIYSICPNSVLPSTARLSYRSSSSICPLSIYENHPSLLRGQLSVVPSGLNVLTLPQHHEPCNFLVGCDDPYPLGLKTSEYLPEDFPSKRLDHIDVLLGGAHISLSYSAMLQMCVSKAILLENSSLCF